MCARSRSRNGKVAVCGITDELFEATDRNLYKN